MDKPEGWHQVMPSSEPSYSIMITTKVWEKNKDNLEKLMKKVSIKKEKVIPITKSRQTELLKEFKDILGIYS